MVGSESVVRKSVGGENTPELRGGAGGLEHGGEGSDLGRRSQTIGDGGDGSEKESGSEELGWCLRSPRRVLPPPSPGPVSERCFTLLCPFTAHNGPGRKVLSPLCL